MNKKLISLLLACALLMGFSIGGSLAWLADRTSEVQNVFTDSDIDITLSESGAVFEDGVGTQSFKMIPGHMIAKNPVVSVEAGSEACWLFVKVKAAGQTDFLTYAIADGWTELTEESIVDALAEGEKVYYKDVEDLSSSAQGVSYDILRTIKEETKDGSSIKYTVSVKDTVTKEMMNNLNTDSYPRLTFTAYASQYWKDRTTPFTPGEAWGNIGN